MATTRNSGQAASHFLLATLVFKSIRLHNAPAQATRALERRHNGLQVPGAAIHGQAVREEGYGTYIQSEQAESRFVRPQARGRQDLDDLGLESLRIIDTA